LDDLADTIMHLSKLNNEKLTKLAKVKDLLNDKDVLDIDLIFYSYI